jgi:nickel transport protein
MVFAYHDGGQVKGEAAFDDGTAAMDANITVKDADGNLVGKTKTGSEGGFALTLSEGKPPFEVEVNDGTGHRATFSLEAAEAAPPEEAGQPAPTPAAGEQAAPAVAVASGDLLTKSEFKRILRQELKPIKSQVARMASAKKVSVRDIIGGLGWILGLVGVALWCRARKERPKK